MFQNCQHNAVVISQMSFQLEGQPSDLRPDEQDMEGVTQALARLQFVYRFCTKKNKKLIPFCRFDPLDLANGLIAGRQTAARLSSKQVCQSISPLIMIDWIEQGNCQARVQVPNPLSRQAPNPDPKVRPSLKNPKTQFFGLGWHNNLMGHHPTPTFKHEGVLW